MRAVESRAIRILKEVKLLKGTPLEYIDKNIRVEIVNLNKLGIVTSEACSGHLGSKPNVKPCFLPYLTWVKSPDEFIEMINRCKAQLKGHGSVSVNIKGSGDFYQNAGEIWFNVVSRTEESKIVKKWQELGKPDVAKVLPLVLKAQRIKEIKSAYDEWKKFLHCLAKVKI